MTDPNKSALEAIEAFKLRARSHRASSVLKVDDLPGSSEHRVQQMPATYAGNFTSDGITVSKDGKVTVSKSDSKPVPQGKVSQVFGKSRVFIPEFSLYKEELVGGAAAESPSVTAVKNSEKPSS